MKKYVLKGFDAMVTRMVSGVWDIEYNEDILAGRRSIDAKYLYKEVRAREVVAYTARMERLFKDMNKEAYEFCTSVLGTTIIEHPFENFREMARGLQLAKEFINKVVFERYLRNASGMKEKYLELYKMSENLAAVYVNEVAWSTELERKSFRKGKRLY